jgi:hypothetical protein
MALGHATQHPLWIRNLLRDILGVSFAVYIFCDNQSVVEMVCKDASNKQTQHVDCEFYVTNQELHEKKTHLKWVPGKDQLANVLTKALGKSAHHSAVMLVQGYPG